MEEKTDKVVGYIEYLGAGGMIGEIVPYTSVEKFKDEILDSLDCGRPVTPVVFSDELDEPLQFDSDTYFPWGFRSEKRVQIPYEIYQTNRRDLVFMEYSPARLAAGAKDYELVYKGQMERWETLDSIYSRHNRDDRPNAKSMRSVSVSDIIVTHKDNETHAFYVQPIGYAADLQPVTQEPQAESDTTPSAFSVPISDLPPLSDELILGLLAKDSSSRADNAAFLEYFNEHPDLAERSAFCKHCYKQIYTYLFVDDHTVGFIRHDMYLELWEGNYLMIVSYPGPQD